MNWIPQTLEQLRFLIGENEFAAGFIVACIIFIIGRKTFLKSPEEKTVDNFINALKEQLQKLQTELNTEKRRNSKCHEKLDASEERNRSLEEENKKLKYGLQKKGGAL